MKEISEKIKKYLEERGWNDLRPSDISKSISIEAAELLENFQWDNRTKEEVKKDKEKVKNVSMELADVVIYCIELAIHLDIDLVEALNSKLVHVKKKYPTSIFNRQVKRGDPGTEKAYLDIKKAYRKGKK